MIIDCAIYRDGRREDVPADATRIAEALATLDRTSEFIWIGLHEPDQAELSAVAAPLPLHPLAVEDALEAHQRPKIEQYDDHLFCALKTISYSADDIETEEINAFLGSHYLLTVRHGDTRDLREVRRRAEGTRHDLEHGPTGALYAVVDAVVDHYEEVATELEIDVQEVESSVFSAERTSDSSRIYRLKRETLEFRRAVLPLRDPVARLARGAQPEGAQPYFRDIADHLTRVAETIDSVDKLLDNALNAHLAQLSIQQNNDMRKLAAGAALIAIPTVVAGIYGMNFASMPELGWTFGYPLMLVLTAGLCGYVYRRFKQSGWL